MKRIILLVGALFFLASCTDELDQIINGSRTDVRGPKTVFQASTEGPAAPETKVYADENMKVLWNEGDQITIFNKITYNHGFEFDGEDGDTAGGFTQFTEIPSSSFVTWADLDNVYAVYPYNSKTKINNSGVMTVTLPSEQAYKEKSFGIGANTMAAVSESNFLAFKNVGGYLSLRLYGDNISVSRITIQGNNGEKIAGKAKIEVPLGGLPTTTMDNTATEAISIVCDPAVKIGDDANNYTDFWFVIPPVTFEKGFTITVTDDKGGVFEKSTSKSFSVTRNTLDWMSALKVVPNYDNVIIQFADANFKAYCVENFDTNKDGEISGAEAEQVTDITVCTDNIKSLGGIEYFTNLQTLSCTGSLIGTKSTTGAYAGQLETINIGQNILLEELDCHGNQLDSLDVSNNPNLNTVICTDNPIEVINLAQGQIIATLEAPEDSGIVYDWEDVIGPMFFPDSVFRAYVFTNFDTDSDGILSESECDAVKKINFISPRALSLKGISLFKNLEELNCEVDFHAAGSELILDLTQNTKIKKFYSRYFAIPNLDLSKNTALTELAFYMVSLTSLDVSQCTALASLGFEFAGLTSLDVSHNPALVSLDCSYNGLTSLDISNNTALKGLCCEANFGLSSLICGNNQALETLMIGGTSLGNALDLSQFPALIRLECQDNNYTYNGTVSWTNLDLSGNPELSILKCNGNQLTSLDVSHNTALTSLECYSNQLTSLDVSNNSLLSSLWCDNNPYLTEIWLKEGQTIDSFEYDTDIATIHYKGGVDFGSVADTVDMGLSVKWASWNMGASKIADYGGLYGMGDPTGLETSTSSSAYYHGDASICGTDYDMSHVKWGGHWRLPTKAEIDELYTSCTWSDTEIDGVKGALATAPNGATLFFPYAGNRQGSTIREKGSEGHYWTGDPYTAVHSYGYYDIDIRQGAVHQTDGCENWIGQSIRPVYESLPNAPTSVNVELTSAGTLSEKLAGMNCMTIKSIKISGVMDARDFNFMKWECRNIETVDLSEISVVEYSGEYGTNEEYQETYPADEIPMGAFFYWMSNYHRIFPEELIDEGMSSLKKVVLPSSIRAIRRNAFARAYNLVDINFPEGLEIIDYVSFRYCVSLKSIVLPSSLKTIGLWAFTEMNALESVYCKAIVPPSVNQSFGGIDDLSGARGHVDINSYNASLNAILYVPQGCLDAYRSSDWGTYFTDIREME